MHKSRAQSSNHCLPIKTACLPAYLDTWTPPLSLLSCEGFQILRYLSENRESGEHHWWLDAWILDSDFPLWWDNILSLDGCTDGIRSGLLGRGCRKRANPLPQRLHPLSYSARFSCHGRVVTVQVRQVERRLSILRADHQGCLDTLESFKGITFFQWLLDEVHTGLPSALLPSPRQPRSVKRPVIAK